MCVATLGRSAHLTKSDVGNSQKWHRDLRKCYIKWRSGERGGGVEREVEEWRLEVEVD